MYYMYIPLPLPPVIDNSICPLDVAGSSASVALICATTSPTSWYSEI